MYMYMYRWLYSTRWYNIQLVSAPDLFFKKERGNDVRGNGLGLGLGGSSIKEINAQVQYMTVQYVQCTCTL